MDESAALEVILAMGRYVGRLEARVAELEDPARAVERLRALGHIKPIPTRDDPTASRTFAYGFGLSDVDAFGAAFDEAAG